MNTDTNEIGTTPSSAIDGGRTNDRNNTTSYVTEATTVDIGATLKPFKITAGPDDLTIKDYLAREVVLYDFAVNSDMVSPLSFEPFRDFLNAPDIAQKCKYRHLIRGTLRLKLVVTSSPYATGQFVMATYYDDPLPLITTFGSRKFLLNCTHSILDLGSTTDATLHIPMHVEYPYAVISAGDSETQIRKIKLLIVNNSYVSDTQSGSTPRVNMKVYASLEDAELSVPVVEGFGSVYTAETIEAMDGPISYPMSVISNVSHFLKDIPIIGPFAHATNLVSTGLGKLALLFGFSRPKDLSVYNYPHEEDVSSYVGNVRSKGLTLDPLQEVSIDNTILGEHGDNLTYKNIINRWGLLGTTEILFSDSPGDLKLTIPVRPSYDSPVSAAQHIPHPLAFGSQLFTAWRGTIKYKFVFPANRFVRAKIRIWWTPTPLTGSDYAQVTRNASSVLLAITTTTECTFEVPYAHQRAYLPIGLIGNHPDQFCNGYVHLSVEEPLFVPSETYRQQVLIYIAAGDDMEFVIPTGMLIQYLAHELPAVGDRTDYQIGDVDNNPPSNGSVTEAPSQFWFSTYTSAASSNSVTPFMECSYTTIPKNVNNDAAIFNIGERFNSFRPLLKRFSDYLYINGHSYTNSEDYVNSIFVPYMPLYYSGAYQQGSNVVNMPLMNTPIKYLSSCFAGTRGSVRYQITILEPGPRVVTIYRGAGYPLSNNRTDVTTHPSYFAAAKRFATTGSAVYNVNMGEPIIVEVPHQFSKNFMPTKFTQLITILYGIFIEFQGNVPKFEVRVSAGEDFMPVMWNGIPVLTRYSFYQTSVPPLVEEDSEDVLEPVDSLKVTEDEKNI